MNELLTSLLGIYETIEKDQHSPRRKYSLDRNGRYQLAAFFGIDPSALNRYFVNEIWLTPATIEDLLIYAAFHDDKQKFVVINDVDGKRKLFAFSDVDIAKRLNREGSHVLVNPNVIHKH